MASLFRRANGTYYICKYEQGKRFWKNTGERVTIAALKKLFEFQTFPNPERRKATSGNFVADLLAHSERVLASKTIELYKRTLSSFQSLCGDVKLEKITPRDTDIYTSQRLKTVSPVTCTNIASSNRRRSKRGPAIEFSLPSPILRAILEGHLNGEPDAHAPYTQTPRRRDLLTMTFQSKCTTIVAGILQSLTVGRGLYEEAGVPSFSYPILCLHSCE